MEEHQERKRKVEHLTLAAVAFVSVPVATLGLFGMIMAGIMLVAAAVTGWIVG